MRDDAGRRPAGPGSAGPEPAGSGPAGRRAARRRPAGPRAEGTVAILAGAAAWGSTGTAAHFAPAGASSASIGAARIVLGGALLLVNAVRTTAGRRAVAALLSGTGRSRAALALAAVSVGGYQICFFTAVRITGVAIGTVVAIGSAPVFTGGLSWLTGGSRPGRTWMLATAAAVAGCAVLVTGGQSSGARPAGIVLALAAGLCYAVYAVVAARFISAGRPESAVMGVIFGGAGVLLVPVLAVSSPGWLLTGRGIAVTAYLGVVTTALAYLLYGRGLRTVPAPIAVTLGLAEPVVAAILGVTVVGERLTGSDIAGLALVGLALAALVLGSPPAGQDAGPPAGPLPGLDARPLPGQDARPPIGPPGGPPS
jgi:DME family drug/metabolite transporter